MSLTIYYKIWDSKSTEENYSLNNIKAVCVIAGGFLNSLEGVSIVAFTDGNERFFEKLMKETPNSNKKICGIDQLKFRYRFRDLDCRYCIEYKRCPAVDLCLYVMDNLSDLYGDEEFFEAIMAAKSCETPQRRTLIYLLEEQTCV